MKVGMLTSTDERCGIAQYTHDLCSGFGSDVDIEVVPVRSGTDHWSSYIGQSANRLNACDVVHIQHDYSFWGSILPGKNAFFRHMASIRRPKVITAHTLDSASDMLAVTESGAPARFLKSMLAYVSGYRDSIERATFDLADRIIVHDNPAARILQNRGISGDKIRIVPMGVPEPVEDSGSGDDFVRKHRLEGRKLIVIFGFIRPGRGYEAVLDIMAELDSGTMLVIAGGAQNPAQELYLESLKGDIEKRGLSDRVFITGYLTDTDVAGVMQSADIVLCSQESGTGSYSVQVALGYGAPILASDLPCFDDLKTEYGCLITFRNGDRQDLLSKIKLLLTDKDLSRTLSSSASGYAHRHTWRKVAEMTEAVYREHFETR